MSKINEDKCTYCSVEAPAMVYKCPECEFNPERKKETIINGVDVSGCSSLGHTIVGITCGNGERKRLGNRIITIHQLCSTNSNCLFKQLKRKERECENLKEKLCKAAEENKFQFVLREENANYEQTLDEIDKIAHKKRDFDLTGRSTGLLIEICKVAEDFCKIRTLINDIRSNQNGKV